MSLLRSLDPKPSATSRDFAFSSVPVAAQPPALDPRQILADHAPVALALLDRNLRYLHVNPQWKREFYLERTAVIGMRHDEIFPDLHPSWQQVYARCLDGRVERCESAPLWSDRNGSAQCSWEVRPWRQEDGQVGGLILSFFLSPAPRTLWPLTSNPVHPGAVIQEDLAECRPSPEGKPDTAKSRELLALPQNASAGSSQSPDRETAERGFSPWLDRLPWGVMVLDRLQHILYSNEAVSKLRGITPLPGEEITSWLKRGFKDPIAADAVDAEWKQRGKAQTQPIVMTLPTAEGLLKPWEFSSHPLESEQVMLVMREAAPSAPVIPREPSIPVRMLPGLCASRFFQLDQSGAGLEITENGRNNSLGKFEEWFSADSSVWQEMHALTAEEGQVCERYIESHGEHGGNEATLSPTLWRLRMTRAGDGGQRLLAASDLTHDRDLENARQNAQNELDRLKLVVMALPLPVLVVDGHGIIQLLNQAARDLQSAEGGLAWRGLPLVRLIAPDGDDSVMSATITAALDRNGKWQGTRKFTRIGWMEVEARRLDNTTLIEHGMVVTLSPKLIAPVAEAFTMEEAD